MATSHRIDLPPFGIAWTPDGERFCITGGGGESKTGVPNGVHQYTVEDNLIHKHREGNQKGFVYGSVMSASSGLLAASIGHEEGGHYHEIVLYRAEDLLVLGSVFKVEGGITLRSAISADGGLLAVGGDDGILRLVELPIENPGPGVTMKGEARIILTSEPVKVGGPKDPTEIKHVVFHPNGRHIVGSLTDGTWRVWTITPDSLVEESCYPAATGLASAAGGDVALSCRCGYLTKDGSQLFTIHNVRRAPKAYGRAAVLTRWSVKEVNGKLQLTPDKVATISQHPVTALTIGSPDGKYGAIGNGEGEIYVFRTSDLSVRARLRNAHGLPVTDLAFQPKQSDGDMLLVSVGADKTLRLYQPFPRRRVCRDFLLLIFFILLLLAITCLWNAYEEGSLPLGWGDWVHAIKPNYRDMH